MRYFIKSINELLETPHLKASFEKAILLITTNKFDYFDFGCTRFLGITVEDSDTVIICSVIKKMFNNFIEENKDKKEIYVACDAGLSRSPAFAYAMAKRLGQDDIAKTIEKTYRFMNQNFKKQLLED